MKEIINDINQRYNLQIESYERIQQGIKSEVYLLQDETEKYIMRVYSIKDELNNLVNIDELALGFTPNLLTTSKKSKFITHKNKHLVIQKYISTQEIPKNDAGILNKIATSVQNMSSTINSLKLHLKDDEYSLNKLYGLIFQNNELYTSFKKYNLEEDIKLLAKIESQKFNDCIHGDCGTWNMLYDGNIKIIDFGEIRIGSKYFDFAAAFVSYIDFNELTKSRFLNLLNTYLSFLKINDVEEFITYCLIWELRGILAKFIFTEHSIDNDIKRYTFIKEAMNNASVNH